MDPFVCYISSHGTSQGGSSRLSSSLILYLCWWSVPPCHSDKQQWSMYLVMINQRAQACSHHLPSRYTTDRGDTHQRTQSTAREHHPLPDIVTTFLLPTGWPGPARSALISSDQRPLMTCRQLFSDLGGGRSRPAPPVDGLASVGQSWKVA